MRGSWCREGRRALVCGWNLSRLKVLDARDVDDGATINVRSDAVRVMVHTDFDILLGYESGVVICDVVSFAI